MPIDNLFGKAVSFVTGLGMAACGAVNESKIEDYSITEAEKPAAAEAKKEAQPYQPEAGQTCAWGEGTFKTSTGRVRDDARYDARQFLAFKLADEKGEWYEMPNGRRFVRTEVDINLENTRIYDLFQEGKLSRGDSLYVLVCTPSEKDQADLEKQKKADAEMKELEKQQKELDGSF